MNTIRDWFSSFAGEAGGAAIFSALIFLAVFVTVLAVGWRLLQSAHSPLRDGAGARSSAKRVLLNGRLVEIGGSPDHAQSTDVDADEPDPFVRAKRPLRTIFRALAALIMVTLVTLTILSYLHSTPGTGDILLTIVLAAVTLMAFQKLLSIDRMHREPDPASTARLHQTLQGGLASKLQEALSGSVTIDWNVASPEVHRIDEEGLARARTMAKEGKSVDEICRAMEGDYANWAPPHQQAFRNVMQAVIDQS